MKVSKAEKWERVNVLFSVILHEGKKAVINVGPGNYTYHQLPSVAETQIQVVY